MLRPLPLIDADVRFDADAIPAARAERLFGELRDQISWRRHRLKLFGRELDAPRLSSWIGDRDAAYTYSRVRFEPQPWPPVVAALRDELALRLGVRFNGVLANCYRDGQDSMGWHSDDERELGADPVIASLSFGATRRFRLQHRARAEKPVAIELGAGSLLVMAGATQRNYRHDLPKTARAVGERINLTFRRILVSDG